MRTLVSSILLIILLAGVGLSQNTRLPEADARKLIATRVEPVYPPMAKQMRLSGRVQLDVFVDADGSVAKTQPLNGNLMLAAAATTAVKQWKFTPFKADGKSSGFVSTITFDFKM